MEQIKSTIDIAKIFTPQLNELGFITKGNKRLWLDDNGLYVIIVEFQPLYSEGFFLNVGVKFMWALPQYISYDYEYEYSRILIPHSPIQEVLFYNSPTFDNDIEYMKEKLNEKIAFYRQMRGKNILFDRLLKRKQSSQSDNIARDVELGVAGMLVGNTDIALDIFNQASKDFDFAKECLANADSVETFEKYLLERVNNVRSEFSSKHRYKLPPITSL